MQKVADLVRLAIENEVRTRVYYAEAARIAGRGESQMVFLELTDMEQAHAKLLVDRFGPLLRDDGTDPPRFLQQLDAMIVDTPTGEEAALIAHGEMRPVIDFAIGLEVRARDAYRALGARLTDPDQQALCEVLAKEEQKHHDSLRVLRVSVDTEFEDRPAL